jgi:hypothetical protein
MGVAAHFVVNGIRCLPSCFMKREVCCSGTIRSSEPGLSNSMRVFMIAGVVSNSRYLNQSLTTSPIISIVRQPHYHSLKVPPSWCFSSLLCVKFGVYAESRRVKAASLQSHLSAVCAVRMT